MVKVDREKCIGCNACVSTCPEGFKMKDGKASVKEKDVNCIEKAADICPTGAIKLDDQETEKERQDTDKNFTRGRGRGRKRGKGRGRKSGGKGRRRK